MQTTPSPNAIYLPLVQQPIGLPQSPPPATSTYYVKEVDDLSWMRTRGCSARNNQEQGAMILDFGSPREIDTGTTPNTSFGTRLLSTTDPEVIVNLDQIKTSVIAFIAGYRGQECGRPEEQFAGKMTIIVGLSNSKVPIASNVMTDTKFIDNTALSALHGNSWALMIRDINKEIGSAYPNIQATGGIDAEIKKYPLQNPWMVTTPSAAGDRPSERYAAAHD